MRAVICFIKNIINKIKCRSCGIRESSSYIHFSVKARGAKLGGHNKISKGVVFNRSELGFGSYIGMNSVMDNTVIGKYCSIAGGVKVISGAHPTDTFVSTHPIFYSKSPWKEWKPWIKGESKFNEFSFAGGGINS